MENKQKQVPHHYADRQWDARFNVQQDSYLDNIIRGIKQCVESGKLQYVLIGGIEIGTRPFQDDYKIRHVHVAAIFNNRVTKRNILKQWNIKEGNGYYLVPRDRDLPYTGWKNHHIKLFSKVDPDSLCLYEYGELPKDTKRKRIEASEEEKKKNVNEILIEIRQLVEEDKDDEAFTKYPRNYLLYGEKIKSMIQQKRDFKQTDGNPHIWLHGYPGTGKTAILNYIYPHYYKKNLHNRFFDLYDPKIHSHVLLEDLDHEALEKLSVNFIKTTCDEAGFPVDQKYKTPQLARTTVLITSNFTISVLLNDAQQPEVTKQALRRRFYEINIYELLRLLGVKLLPKEERNKLKSEGNTDVSKLFMSWDYQRDQPTGEPLKDPTYYQHLIKTACYAE